MFEQYSSALHQKYPGLLIEGDNYPPSTIKYNLAQFLGLAKILIILCVVSGTDPFPWFGMETPALFTSAMENKVCRRYMVAKNSYYYWVFNYHRAVNF